jgi:uncharacterized glyoxalase superfamily protein PhnB
MEPEAVQDLEMRSATMKAAVYLEFEGEAVEVIETYQAVFDAQVVCEYAYDATMTQDQELVGKVFHAELKIGELNLYLADSGKAPSFPSMKFVVEIPREAGAQRILEKLAQNGRLIHPFQKMPVGPTIAQAEDRFGIRWEVVIC